MICREIITTRVIQNPSDQIPLVIQHTWISRLIVVVCKLGLGEVDDEAIAKRSCLDSMGVTRVLQRDQRALPSGRARPS